MENRRDLIKGQKVNVQVSKNSKVIPAIIVKVNEWGYDTDKEYDYYVSPSARRPIGIAFNGKGIITPR